MIKYCCMEMDEISTAIHKGGMKDTFFLSIYNHCMACNHRNEQQVRIIFCPFCGKRIEAENKKHNASKAKEIDSRLLKVPKGKFIQPMTEEYYIAMLYRYLPDVLKEILG